MSASEQAMGGSLRLAGSPGAVRASPQSTGCTRAAVHVSARSGVSLAFAHNTTHCIKSCIPPRARATGLNVCVAPTTWSRARHCLDPPHTRAQMFHPQRRACCMKSTRTHRGNRLCASLGIIHINGNKFRHSSNIVDSSLGTSGPDSRAALACLRPPSRAFHIARP